MRFRKISSGDEGDLILRKAKKVHEVQGGLIAPVRGLVDFRPLNLGGVQGIQPVSHFLTVERVDNDAREPWYLGRHDVDHALLDGLPMNPSRNNGVSTPEVMDMNSNLMWETFEAAELRTHEFQAVLELTFTYLFHERNLLKAIREDKPLYLYSMQALSDRFIERVKEEHWNDELLSKLGPTELRSAFRDAVLWLKEQGWHSLESAVVNIH